MIGIDIGKHAIKIAVIKKNTGKPVVEQLIYEPLPFSANGTESIDAQPQILSSLLKNISKTEKTAALSIPASSAILKIIEVDSSFVGEDLESEVQLSISESIPFPIDEVYLDFVPLGNKPEAPDTQEIIVAVTKRDIVDRQISQINSKSIKEKIVDIDTFALGLLMEKIHGKQNNDIYAVINIGYQSTDICFFANNELIFSQEQQIGGQQLTEAIAEGNALSLTEAEKNKCDFIDSISEVIIEGYLDNLIEQVALSFEMFQTVSEESPKCTYLTGGGANVPEIIRNLSENIPEQTFKLLPITDAVSIKNNQLSAELVNYFFATCIGLALRG